MNVKSAEIFKGLLAIILLLIYFFALGYMVLKAYQWEPVNEAISFNSNRIWAVNLVGGLVAAVIIANLAISKPGGTPTPELLTKEFGKTFMQVVIWIYIAVWLIVGFGAFHVGVIKHPGASEALNEIGKAWLGIALGAAYAWFGINQES